MKARPWMILWVDDAQQICCVVALTTKHDYVGSVRTGHQRYSTAGAWAMVQPLCMCETAKSTGVTLSRRVRRTVAAHLHATFDLIAP